MSVFKTLQKVHGAVQKMDAGGFIVAHVANFCGDEFAEQLTSRIMTPVVGPAVSRVMGKALVARAKSVWS